MFTVANGTNATSITQKMMQANSSPRAIRLLGQATSRLTLDGVTINPVLKTKGRTTEETYLRQRASFLWHPQKKPSEGFSSLIIGENVIGDRRVLQDAGFEETDIIMALMGSKLYVDSKATAIVPEHVLANPDLIEIDAIDFQEETTMAYTAAVLTALESMDLSQKVLLDFGASEGILSVAAILQGAKMSVAIDINPESPEKIASNTRRNQIDPKQIPSLDLDLTKTETAKRSILEITEAPQIVLANTGPFYGDLDIRSAELAAAIPSVNRVIFGGYNPFSSEHGSGGMYFYGALVAKMKALGFQVDGFFDNPSFIATTAIVFSRE